MVRVPGVRVRSHEHHDLPQVKGSTDESDARWNSRCWCVLDLGRECRSPAELCWLCGGVWACEPTCLLLWVQLNLVINESVEWSARLRLAIVSRSCTGGSRLSSLLVTPSAQGDVLPYSYWVSAPNPSRIYVEYGSVDQFPSMAGLMGAQAIDGRGITWAVGTADTWRGTTTLRCVEAPRTLVSCWTIASMASR